MTKKEQPRRPVEGETVLAYGVRLTVLSTQDVDGRMIVHCRDLANAEARGVARTEFLELRARQVEMTDPAEHAAAAEKLAELEKVMSSACLNLKLRADLMSWWEEKSLWTADGRILSDNQVAVFKKITGSKPAPERQREAVLLLEAAKG